jgi:hypothetical protein
MRPQFPRPAAPSSGIFSQAQLVVGPLPDKVLGGLPTGRALVSASLSTGVHFNAQASGVCGTSATMP